MYPPLRNLSIKGNQPKIFSSKNDLYKTQTQFPVKTKTQFPKIFSSKNDLYKTQTELPKKQKLNYLKYFFQ